MLVIIGTYTDPILFGTGKILQGKGEGIHVYRLDPSSGSLEFVGKTTGIANPSYLAFDSTQRFLYAVNELKEYEGRPTGTVSAFAVDPDDGSAPVPEPAAHARDRSLSRRRRPAAETRVRRELHERQRVRPAGARRRQPGGGLGLHPASGVEHRSGAPEGPHAHSVTLDASNRYAFVPDLGLDKLMVYRFDSKRGMLEPNAVPWIKMKPGAGPRHVALHPGRPVRVSGQRARFDGGGSGA